MSNEIEDRIRATFQRRATEVKAGLDDQPRLIEPTTVPRHRRRPRILVVAAALIAVIVGAGIWQVTRGGSVRVHSTNPASGMTTTSPPTTSATDPTLPVLAAGELLITPGSGAEGIQLGDVVHPVQHPEFADGSPVTIVNGRVVGGNDSVLRTCEWTRDTTTVPGLELTLEKSSVGGLVVGIRPEHAVTPEGIRAGASLADVHRVYGPTTPLPDHTFDGHPQSAVSASFGDVFFLDAAGTKVTAISVEDGQNSPVDPISCD